VKRSLPEKFVGFQPKSKTADIVDASVALAAAGLARRGSVIREFERVGYVRRVADPSDGREVVVQFIARGIRVLDDVVEVLNLIEQRYARILGENRLGDLQQLLQTLCDNDSNLAVDHLSFAQEHLSVVKEHDGGMSDGLTKLLLNTVTCLRLKPFVAESPRIRWPTWLRGSSDR
jgi:hypothetical protein